MRLMVTIRSIQTNTRKHNRPAEQISAWIKMNQRGLRQRYAQELEKKCGTGTILFAKGDLFQLIHNAGGFKQQGPLWDSPYNLQQMAEMQNDVLVHRNKLGAITRLYGGMVASQYAAPGGPGSVGQPKKFYAPLLMLTTLVLYTDEDVDAMIFRHFKLGMSRFELGQYLITLGGDVDMTKVGRQMLQSRERGSQRSEPATGRRGQVTSMLDQLSTYRSVMWSEMGDPVPMQQLPMMTDDTVPPSTVLQFQPGFFK
ncbi:MAG: hypothetical protein GY835_11615 [bacterium]|nr:hypothetical protein [bacterium]